MAMGYPFFNPQVRLLGDAGVPMPGATIEFFEAGSDTPATVYSDPGLDGDDAIEQPIAADQGGYVGTIFLDPDVIYKVVVKNDDASQEWVQDNYRLTIGDEAVTTIYQELSQARIGALAEGDTLMYYIVGQPFTLPAGLTAPDSQATCRTAPSGGDAVLTIKKNTVDIGTITFADGETDPAFALATDTAFVAGDTLEVIASATLNGIEDVSVTLLGSYGAT